MHRDHTEAEAFIDALFAELKPHKNDLILDLACGRGRHAVYMNQKGYQVDGFDLSEESIQFAKEFENENLRFEVRDMRGNLGSNKYNWVFNLFTSFGYFNEADDDLNSIKAVANCLVPGGKLVLDFMNAQKVAKRLVPEEIKIAEDIEFHIERYAEGNHIIKEIRFNADQQQWRFEEKVKLLKKSDFETLCQKAGLKPVACYGSLDLQPFDEEKSDRYILIAEKL